MSTASSREYEFSPSQNHVFGTLANRMRAGRLSHRRRARDFLFAALVVLAIYRAKLPEDYVKVVLEKASEATRTDLKCAAFQTSPLHSSLGHCHQQLAQRPALSIDRRVDSDAGGSFQKVVKTQGSDISHLMESSSLNKMYALIYTLIVIGLLLFLAAVGLFIYAQVTR